MIPLGLGPRDLVGLARAARAEPLAGPIVVSGLDAAELAAALGREASHGAVVVRSDPDGAAALVRVLSGPVNGADGEVLRAATRASVAVVAVVRSVSQERLPYVLATDVVRWGAGEEPPVAELARVLAAALGPDVTAVAARVPVLRGPAEGVLRGRAVAGAATLTLIRGARVPLAPPLTLQQARLARELARARGAAAPAEPEELARTVGPELGLALATGLVARGLVRRLPVRNRLVEAAVAAAGTAIVATAARRLPS